MNAAAANPHVPGLSEQQKTALVNLLSDEDKGIYQAVRKRIIASGREATGWLRPHTLSSDPVLRRRALEIIHHLERQDADNRFLGFCVSHGEEFDLEEGVWLLAKTQYPEINVGAYQALLDSFAGELAERAADQDSALGTLAVVNEYVFRVLGFQGNQEDYYDPDNSYLNRVIDRRTGSPIGLCAVYWLLSRRLRLPVVGIGMPGHFLCRYQSTTDAYFIDVFNRGKLLSRGDCIKYLQGAGHGFQESFLAPSSPGRTLLRMCANLHQIYAHREQREETERLQRYLVALAK